MSRVVVIGAGLGGLGAALRLQGAGHDVTVLEQQPWVQRHAAAMARALCDGRSRPPTTADPRRDAMDAVFLGALTADPRSFASHLSTLAAAVGGDLLARFMNDASSPADELRVMSALPPRPFLQAAARKVLARR